MRKLNVLLVAAMVTIFISCFGCNSTGGNDMQSIVSDGMELTIESGEHWYGKMKVFILSFKKTPQLAVWLEDSHGNYVATITATGKSAQNNWKSAPKEGRPEALPVWNHRRQQSAGQIDIVSSATPQGTVDVHIDNGLFTNGKEYHVYLEINHSFDYNDHWTKDNSGVNGQPSLIYHARFIAGVPERIPLIPIGHGSVDGSHGNITGELENVTTALHIIKNAFIAVK